jgi:hypothetical protein
MLPEALVLPDQISSPSSRHPLVPTFGYARLISIVERGSWMHCCKILHCGDVPVSCIEHMQGETQFILRC